MKIELVVTRHPALLEYLSEICLADAETKTITHAKPEDVTGKRVCGVLPYALSALCETFTEIPLDIPPELRGVELTIEQIRQYSKAPATYRVISDIYFSTEIVEIINEESTNGRWGLVVLGPKNCNLWKPQERGLESLGKIGKYETYRFTPETGSGQWFMVGGDIEIVAGGTIVKNVNLQSNNEVTIVLGGEFFSIRNYGYKRRSEEINCYFKGKKIKTNTTILASMGVIPCTVEKINEPIPELDSGLSTALKAAGLG